VCIRCSGGVLTEPLPSNDRGIHIQTHRLMGDIYEVRRWDGLRCHDIHIKFHKDWFMHAKLNRGDTETYRQHGDLISLLSFFQNKESRLKMYISWAHKQKSNDSYSKKYCRRILLLTSENLRVHLIYIFSQCFTALSSEESCPITSESWQYFLIHEKIWQLRDKYSRLLYIYSEFGSV
jgi:hypothetical protein